jgi:ABC-type lipoprotein export system ATPase subunit
MDGVALKMLFGDRAKYIGLVFGIAFSTMLMSNQVSIFAGLMLRTAGQILDARGADIWVMDRRVDYVDEIEPMIDTQLGRVRGVDGVDWAVPFFKGLTVAHTRDGFLQQITLLGVDDATLIGVTPRMVLGSVENLKQPDALIIDRAGFQFMWPGEKPTLRKVIELNDHRAVIAGISDASAPFTTFPVVYTKYLSAMNYIGRTRKQMSFVLVHARPAEDTHVLAQRITAETGLKALTWRDFAFATIGYYVKRTGIPVNFGITVALGFIVGAAVVGQTFYIFVLENLREFGSLKAMGVANRTILRMVLLQAMVVAGIGYAIGIGLCALFFDLARLDQPSRFRGAMAGGRWNGWRRLYHHRHRKSRQRPQGHGRRPRDRFPGGIGMTDESIAVRCSGITKSFPAGDDVVEVLHGIDFEVPAGELTMLVGPSGCGKTTLISIIAGILSPTRGTVETCGRLITKLPDAEKVAFRRKAVGFVFQQYNLLPALTAAENAAIPLVAAGMPMAPAIREASATLERIGMGEHLSKPPNQLSGGQQQRVAIARAFVHAPGLIVCDEPTAALDAETGRSVFEILKEAALAADRAVIVVTHDTRIYRFADRIAAMEDRRIRSVRSAPPGQLSEVA